jgi:uncharacterized SAM-binding protein YcdF (DUF218 family)
MKKKSKWLWGTVCLCSITAATLIFSFHEAILQKAGRFMAPEINQTAGVADVVILEGTQFIDRFIVAKGIDLLSSGKARHMIIVLHRVSPDDRPFAFYEDYSSSVRMELQSLGMKKSAFTIIETPIRNPITLTSSKCALETLVRDSVKSALLVSPGFHLRRSYLVYQHLSMPLNIKIYPVACFDDYEPDNWWHEGKGIRDFVSELAKLLYYLGRGYIPLKLSY